VARDVDADMIALGWAQDLAPGRASVVRWALEHTPVPLVLMPLARTFVGGSTPDHERRMSASRTATATSSGTVVSKSSEGR
jgi:hypothetical protein